VPPREPLPLAEAIMQVLGDSKRGAEMGRLGRRIVVDGFSARSMVRQMETLYLSLLTERGVGIAAKAQAQAVS
jgi:hypothetical protein